MGDGININFTNLSNSMVKLAEGSESKKIIEDKVLNYLLDGKIDWLESYELGLDGKKYDLSSESGQQELLNDLNKIKANTKKPLYYGDVGKPKMGDLEDRTGSISNEEVVVTYGDIPAKEVSKVVNIRGEVLQVWFNPSTNTITSYRSDGVNGHVGKALSKKEFDTPEAAWEAYNKIVDTKVQPHKSQSKQGMYKIDEHHSERRRITYVPVEKKVSIYALYNCGDDVRQTIEVKKFPTTEEALAFFNNIKLEEE